ncbi:MAG TPA: MFS transporter, partial [Tepidisphaeraceae bacterium]|nr:MFS transporter [Tepidisphaeraceae bacterium]
GDFCFTLMETVIPSILPLKLQNLGAPSSLIGLLMTTIPHAMTVLVTPVVSYRSDRFRSRWGRRIPFLLIPTPFLTILLILIGYSESIGQWLWRSGVGGSALSATAVTLAVISVLLVAFQFCNMFVQSIYYYLFNDVVPDAFLARFMALFRVVGTAAAALYNILIFPHAQTHMSEIFVGAAVLYFLGFTTMCLMVREGSYPPPPPNIGHRKGLLAAIKTYAVECFSHRFYWSFFLANMMWALVGCASAFSVLFSLSLGLTLTQLGQIAGVSNVVSTLLLYPAGMLSDRVHPLRVAIFVAAVYVPLYSVQLLYLFFDFNTDTVLAIAIAHAAVSLPVAAMWNVAELPLYMKLLPRERYGQFASANALVRSVAMIGGGVVAGVFLDVMRQAHGGSDFAYRYVPVWQVTFFALSLWFFLRLYRGWKARGGMHGYVPPPIGEAVGPHSAAVRTG